MAKYLPHSPMATANALAATASVLYLICAFWVWFSRPTFMGMMAGWAHGVNVSSLPFRQITSSDMIVGFITFAVAAWLTGYLYAWFYNMFLMKK